MIHEYEIVLAPLMLTNCVVNHWTDNTYGSVTLGRSMDLVASFLLKLRLAAVAALPPPKALGLKVSKGGLKLRILAVLDGLLPQCIGESPLVWCHIF